MKPLRPSSFDGVESPLHGFEEVNPPPPLGYGTAASMARADRPSPKREVTMPRDLWTEIDAAVAARGISRAAWLQEAAREKLERERDA